MPPPPLLHPLAAAANGAALHFAVPVWLGVTLGIVPLAAGLFVWAERRAGRRLARLIAARLRAQLAGADSPGRRRARFALWTLALIALTLALARPQLGYEEQTVKRRGLDLLVAVDVSKSMLATDLAPNRLGRARLAILDLLGLLPGDRVGLIAFAGTAFLQAPLTIDYEAVRSATAELDTDLIPRGGTDIAAAIALALDAFGKAEGGHRAILLFTDGEELEEDAVKAAGDAAAAGVKIFTVGLGTPEGALVPQPRTPFGNGGDFVRDRSGAPVRSKLDENRLRQIAAAAGGSYVHLTNSAGGDASMKTLVERGLSSLSTGEIDARVNRRPIERYQWPLGAALLCLGAGSLLGERRRVSRPAARPTAVAALRAAAAAILLPLLAGTVPTADAAAATAKPPSPPADPLELYSEGKYPDAYSAYEELLRKHPDSAQLQFNAGASAFMAGQYDGALESFSRALAAKDADAALQAKTFYNLGNTLAERSSSQKEASDARINDLKNAIQYYNSVLQAPPAKPGADPKQTPLRQDATYNRDLVQKRLDEELKKRQQQKQQQQQKKDQQKSGDKKDPNAKKQDSKSQPSPKPDAKQDPSPSDSDQNPGDNSDQPPSPSKDGKPQNQPGSADQPPRPDPNGKPDSGQGDKDSPEKGDEGNQSDNPGDRPPENGGEPRPRDGKSASGQKPGEDPSPEGEKNGERPQGELTARDAGQPSPAKEGNENPAEAAAAGRPGANGRMSAAQARALLGALRNEDDKVLLNNPSGKKSRREAVYNDW